MQRASPEHLTEADFYRAKKSVEQTKKLFAKGKTPGQLIAEMIELISCDRSARDNKKSM